MDSNSLYAFLKKNAAHSTGVRSNKRQSDIDSLPGNGDRVQTFNQPSQPQQTFANSSKLDNNLVEKKSVYTFGGEDFRGSTATQSTNQYRPQPQPQQSNNHYQTSQNPIRINQSSTVNSIQSGNSIRTTSSGFQSARGEASQVLDFLSCTIRKQINNIDHKLQSFNKDVLRQLREHTQNFKKRVNFMIEEAYRQNQKHLGEIQRNQEQRIAGQLVQIKQILQNEYIKVQVMKGQINQTNWKKIAGAILSSEMQQKVLQLVQRSENIQVRAPDWNENTASNLRQIQQLVRQSIKLN